MWRGGGEVEEIGQSSKETTDRIGKILNKHNIRTIFKSPKKIGQILRNRVAFAAGSMTR